LFQADWKGDEMKVVILAGGYGTRISEESTVRPKPMVEIGGRPIIWHIMKIYSAYGFNEFVICLGYKGSMIKEYFINYFMHMSDIKIDIKNNKTTFLQNNAEPWLIDLIDTGENSMTGGRLRRVKEHVGNETFCLTYGDGVTDINIKDLVAFHRKQKSIATLSAVQPPGRFGVFDLKEDQSLVSRFREKPIEEASWINGGFFVLEPEVFDFIEGDLTVFEQEPLQNLARAGMLSAFKHDGFWQSMDTLRDRNVLEDLWKTETPPWKVWS